MKQRIHFIGIGGSAIAPLAVEMSKSGYTVSGSDANVFDPALTLLNNNNIDWYEGIKPEKIKDADLIIIGGSMLMKDGENPEFVEAKKSGKQIESFTYLIKKHIIKEESIVVCGTYGKTTITSLIAWILETANLNPSFLIGGLPLNFEYGIRKTNSKYSVVEGDEYAASFGFDMTPKFLHYNPKHTIITAAQWDHVNMYPTEESYIDAYKKLSKLVEKNNGQLYLSQNGENNEIVQREYNGKSQTYGLKHGNFTAENIEFTEEKTSFSVKKENQLVGSFETQLIGLHNIENCLAAIALTWDLGIDLEKIKEGLKTYKGVKRRLEHVGTSSKGAIIIDDFAHSAIKAQSTLEALRTRYKKNKIITIYTPRVSERESKDTLNWYQKTFENTDHVIIPKITVKKSTQKEFRIHGIDIINAINKDENSKHYFPKEEQILNFLKESSNKNTVIVFMSAGGWGDLMKKALNI
jgi:UDP-N-acetylmuramate: L-alanyl-gamma-D-glutamyl-meso-diaminopimelate ligase